KAGGLASAERGQAFDETDERLESACDRRAAVGGDDVRVVVIHRLIKFVVEQQLRVVLGALADGVFGSGATAERQAREHRHDDTDELIHCCFVRRPLNTIGYNWPTS